MALPRRRRGAPTPVESTGQDLLILSPKSPHVQPNDALQRGLQCLQKPPSAKRLLPSAAATAMGSALFGLFVFLAGACPFLLPHVFLAFCVTAIPWRLWSFAVAEPVNLFYLADYCYFVNAAAFLFLLAPPAARSARLEAAVYAMADGPIAFALIAWECAWVWSSPEHSVSVLLHLLPGLAMFAYRHLPRLTSWQQLAACAGNLREPSRILHLGSCIADSDAGERGVLQRSEMLTWLFAVPLAFYAVWQITYFCVVQVSESRRPHAVWLCLPPTLATNLAMSCFTGAVWKADQAARAGYILQMPSQTRSQSKHPSQPHRV